MDRIPKKCQQGKVKMSLKSKGKHLAILANLSFVEKSIKMRQLKSQQNINLWRKKLVPCACKYLFLGTPSILALS